MLLAINIGNTNVTAALFKGRKLVAKWSGTTRSIKNAISAGRFLSRKAKIDGVCICSVVPKLNRIFDSACKKRFGIKPLFAAPKTIGIDIGRYDPRQIGADRLVNAVAAFERFKGPLIVVDIGTGITFDAVDAKGKFLGGAIVPGLGLAARALYEMTARLPLVRPKKPGRAIGRSTQECITSGLFYGWAGLIDNVVRSIAREMKARPIVIATGGGARAIAKEAETIDHIDADLTLKGLRIVWEKTDIHHKIAGCCNIRDMDQSKFNA